MEIKAELKTDGKPRLKCLILYRVSPMGRDAFASWMPWSDSKRPPLVSAETKMLLALDLKVMDDNNPNPPETSDDIWIGTKMESTVATFPEHL